MKATPKRSTSASFCETWTIIPQIITKFLLENVSINLHGTPGLKLN